MALPTEEYIKLDDELLVRVESSEADDLPIETKYLPVPKWWQRYQPVLITLSVVLIATASFGLGRLSKIQESKVPLRVEYRADLGGVAPSAPGNLSQPTPTNSAVLGASNDSSGQVVGSKNSTKYHFPWCGGAKQISPKNLITFDSIEAARAAGYTPAGNCKGLK